MGLTDEWICVHGIQSPDPRHTGRVAPSCAPPLFRIHVVWLWRRGGGACTLDGSSWKAQASRRSSSAQPTATARVPAHAPATHRRRADRTRCQASRHAHTAGE